MTKTLLRFSACRPCVGAVDAGIVPGAIEWHVEATRGGYVAPRRFPRSILFDGP